MTIPLILPCPACKLQKRPEIIGKQATVGAHDFETRFRVQCPTCGEGHKGQSYDTPEEAVEYWSAGQGDRDTASRRPEEPRSLLYPVPEEELVPGLETE